MDSQPSTEKGILGERVPLTLSGDPKWGKAGFSTFNLHRESDAGALLHLLRGELLQESGWHQLLLHIWGDTGGCW